MPSAVVWGRLGLSCVSDVCPFGSHPGVRNGPFRVHNVVCPLIIKLIKLI